MASARLRRLYVRTDYVVAGGVIVRVGRASAPALACLGASAGAILTAANPLSRRMPEGWNLRMTARLGDRLGPWVRAEGRLGAWREAGFFAAGDPRRMAVLGRRFRQNAIVVLERGRAARLVLLR